MVGLITIHLVGDKDLIPFYNRVIDLERGETNLIEAIIHGVILAFGLILPLGVQNVFVFNQGAIQLLFLEQSLS